jgi:hypothetical protein
MARIRTIKPEFWTSEQVADCSPTARLLFVGLWNFSDDGGVHVYSAKRVKMEIFPSDGFSDGYVNGLLNELLSTGLLKSYQFETKHYLKVSGWHHQKIEKVNFKHPQPDENTEFDDRSTTIRRPFDDSSPPDVDVDIDVSSLEGKGREINPTTATRTQAIFKSCFDQNEMRIKELYPHADFAAERETCIAHYRMKPVPIDCYPIVLKWFQRVLKDKTLPQVSTYEQKRAQQLLKNAESCRTFAGGGA